jgi:SAM-dependent methyltransferase
LDIGCGLGTESLNFALAGAEVTLVDLSKTSLELCKKRFELYGVKGTFVVGNAEELSEILPQENVSNKFDLIWAFGAIHHTPHPEKIVEQMKKLLKEGGEIRAMVYSKVSYKLFFLMKETGVWDFSKLDQIISEYAEAQVGCPVAFTYTLDDVRKLFEGFKLLELKKAHIFPYKIPEYKEYKYVKEDCWANVNQETFANLESELGWHTLVKVTSYQ